MHILSVYYTHKPGGFCKRLYRLLGALAGVGHTVHYFALDDPGAKLAAEVCFHKIPFPLARRSGLLFWTLFILWCPVYLTSQALRLPLERFVVFGAFYSAICLPARIIRRTPLILFMRSLVFKINELTDKPPLVRTLSNLVDTIGLRSASKVVCMSEAMKHEIEIFLGRPLKRCAVLPNDVPHIPSTVPRPPRDTGVLHLFTSGVLDRRKNVQLLLDALASVQVALGSGRVTLTIAGDGPLVEVLKAYAAGHQLSACTFLGWVDDVTPHLRQADVLLHPSLHEGAPNSVLEALALEVPVLAADTPELRELLFHRELLFDPHDAAALAAKLQSIIETPSALEHLARLCTGRARELRFDWDERAPALIAALADT